MTVRELHAQLEYFLREGLGDAIVVYNADVPEVRDTVFVGDMALACHEIVRPVPSTSNDRRGYPDKPVIVV